MAKKKKSSMRAKASKLSRLKRTPSRARPAKTKAPIRASGRRRSWLDAGHTPIIDQYARQLSSFMEAMADGVIDDGEVKAQEQRLAKIMRDVERRLDDEQHELVTRLLCELTAYDIMQMLNTMHAQKPRLKFRG